MHLKSQAPLGRPSASSLTSSLVTILWMATYPYTWSPQTLMPLEPATRGWQSTPWKPWTTSAGRASASQPRTFWSRRTRELQLLPGGAIVLRPAVVLLQLLVLRTPKYASWIILQCNWYLLLFNGETLSKFKLSIICTMHFIICSSTYFLFRIMSFRIYLSTCFLWMMITLKRVFLKI